VPDEIRTQRLVLRRARVDDAQPMHAIMSDSQAMRYWWTPPHASMGETER
jgi:[ribosomal protein S5]-alanine N-acetyltransferase